MLLITFQSCMTMHLKGTVNFFCVKQLKFMSFVFVMQCIIRYEATSSVGWYAVALQIEDFASPTDLIPLSSVPAQFLVLVFSSSEPCSSQPEFVGVTRLGGSCVGVPFNTTFNEPLIVQSGGVGVRSVIVHESTITSSNHMHGYLNLPMSALR